MFRTTFSASMLVATLVVGSASSPPQRGQASFRQEVAGEGFTDDQVKGFLGEAFRSLKARQASSTDLELARYVFAGTTKEQLKAIKETTKLLIPAIEAEQVILTDWLQSPGNPFWGASTWMTLEDAARLLVNAGYAAEDAAFVIQAALRATKKGLEPLREIDRLVDLALAEAEEGIARICTVWRVEGQINQPGLNPSEQHHMHKLDGYWRLDPGSRQYRASFQDPEMRTWTYTFSLPVFALKPGDPIEFNSIEGEGMFLGALGRWSGSVSSEGRMGGTLSYTGGGCCSSGRLIGTWQASYAQWDRNQ